MRFPSPPPGGWHDEVLKVDTAFSLGFVRPLGRSGSARASARSGTRAPAALSPSPTRDREVAFAYVMNRLGFHLRDDPRENALRRALYGSLADMEGDAEK